MTLSGPVVPAAGTHKVLSMGRRRPSDNLVNLTSLCTKSSVLLPLSVCLLFNSPPVARRGLPPPPEARTSVELARTELPGVVRCVEWAGGGAELREDAKTVADSLAVPRPPFWSLLLAAAPDAGEAQQAETQEEHEDGDKDCHDDLGIMITYVAPREGTSPNPVSERFVTCHNRFGAPQPNSLGTAISLVLLQSTCFTVQHCEDTLWLQAQHHTNARVTV